MASYWILDHRIADPLNGLSFYVLIHEGPYSNCADQKVRFGHLEGELEVLCSADGLYIQPQHICVDGKLKSDKVAEFPHNARGSYIVISGDHIGTLCRRVSHIPEERENRTFICQPVSIVKEGRGYKQSVLSGKPFSLKRHEILEVHESAEMRKAGNADVEAIRKQLNGNFRAGGNKNPAGRRI